MPLADFVNGLLAEIHGIRCFIILFRHRAKDARQGRKRSSSPRLAPALDQNAIPRYGPIWK
jgi:hypothetical protein